MSKFFESEATEMPQEQVELYVVKNSGTEGYMMESTYYTTFADAARKAKHWLDIGDTATISCETVWSRDIVHVGGGNRVDLMFSF